MSMDVLRHVKLRSTQASVTQVIPEVKGVLASEKENADAQARPMRRLPISRSPGGTPLKSRENRSPANAKFFNRALSDKFRHTRTPPKEPNTAQAL